MTRPSSEIEREIEATRARVEATAEALKQKFSIGQMVNEATRYIGESEGGEMAARLREQVKSNPLPLALVGVGLAWLMSGRGQPHLRSSRSDADDAYGVYVGGSHPDYAGRSTGIPEPDVRGPGSEAGGMASTAAGLAGSVAHAAGAAAGAVGNAASAARSGAAAALRGSSRAYRGTAHAGSHAYDRAADFGGRTRRGLAEADPLVLGGIGLVIGAAIGVLLPRTETEDRTVGPAADRLHEDAGDYARHAYERGVRVAEEGYRAAAREAEAQGFTSTGESDTGGTGTEAGAEPAPATPDASPPDDDQAGFTRPVV